MVNALIEKYGTCDPFRLIKMMNIILIIEPLGTINGYYNRCYRQRFIHINADLNQLQQYYVACHELGHAVLHKGINISFMENFTHCNTDKIEAEADAFAYELMMQNIDWVRSIQGELDHVE